jgi:subtilisin family serine protease
VMKPVATLVAWLVAGVLSAAPATASDGGDPYSARQWYRDRIRADEASLVATGQNALVAIVDSGVDLTHPDLALNLVVYPDADFVEPSGSCLMSKKGKVCTQDGPQDFYGHGTHVAGIVGAVKGNGIGTIGLAPSSKLLPIRVLDADGQGSISDIASGITYAVDKNAHVINLSLGFSSADTVIGRQGGAFRELKAAIDYASSKGAVVVVAAGNETFPLCAEPAAYADVICVGSTDEFDTIAHYSNSDAVHPNYLVAPGGRGLGAASMGENSATSAACGGEIFSTFLRGRRVFCSPESGYEADSGTSMAAPMVSAVAALLAGKGLAKSAIVSCIKRTSDDLGVPGRDPIYGFGRVNAYRAVTSC